MADEEQLDEVLEELWVLEEHGEIAEVERMEVHGALAGQPGHRKDDGNGAGGIGAASARAARSQAVCESVS